MYQIAKPLFLVCETPLHVGSGSDLGVVDLPIQRERHTSFPKIEASSLKGAIREVFEENANNQFDFDVNIHKTFGYDSAFEGRFNKNWEKISDEAQKMKAKTQNDYIDSIKKEFKDATDFAGALGFTDARLLLFPVKSMKGVFAWITCPRVLRRFETDMNLAYQTENQSCKINNLADLTNPIENHCFLLTEKSDLVIGKTDNIVLEEYAFKATAIKLEVGKENDKQLLQDWVANKLFPVDKVGKYWHEKAKSSIVILNDDDFKDFVNLSTEVITRTKIDNEKGTVVGGALFTEEYLPSESVMYTLVLASPEFSSKPNKKTAEDVMTFFENIPAVIQIGGNATHGKGIVRTVFEKKS